MMIGERSAEKLKLNVGCAYPYDEEKFMNVKGETLQGFL